MPVCYIDKDVMVYNKIKQSAFVYTFFVEIFRFRSSLHIANDPPLCSLDSIHDADIVQSGIRPLQFTRGSHITMLTLKVLHNWSSTSSVL